MESMERSSRKVRTGIVVSDAREKTVTVAIELQFPHPKYKKIVKKTRKLHAHDESFEAKVGEGKCDKIKRCADTCTVKRKIKYDA